VKVICELRSALEAARTEPPHSGIIRVSVPCSEPPLTLLAGSSVCDRMYWRPRDGGQEIAGIGCAHLLTGPATTPVAAIFEALAPLRATAAGCRFFGGLAFGPASDAPWNALGAWRFALPRFELNGSTLACNLLLGEDPDAEFARAIAALETIGFAEPAALPTCISQQDLTSRDTWMQAVSDALDAIASGEINKVVLARRIRLAFQSPASPVGLVRKLSEAAGSCFVFLLESDGVAFLGASPERLYRRSGSDFETEALAGTRPRSDDPTSDAELAAALLSCEKERREHRNVVDGLLRALEDVGCQFGPGVTGEPSLRRLPRVQHLYQQIQCVLPSALGDAELVQALQPTSAVGGDPRTAALDLIAELETFDRGWYAGLVGVLGADDADFAVAIRSALLHGSQADLFSGAGIVAGSDPAREWDETVDKMAWLTRGIFA
jgi:menaquinone-specific isochorismate synthase